MHHSIHVSRWVSTVAGHGLDLHMFPIDAGEPNPNLAQITLHWPEAPDGTGEVPPEPLAPPRRTLLERAARFAAYAAEHPRSAVALTLERIRSLQGTRSVSQDEPPETTSNGTALRIAPFKAIADDLGSLAEQAAGSVRLGESDATAPVLHGPGVLASLIRRLQPDIVHSMEFQHAGYLVLKAKELYGPGFPPWLATNWGSDIYYFQRFDDHRRQISRLLKAIDYYSCECQRDVGLARELGFTGRVMPVLPNSGGFDFDHLSELSSSRPPSQRKLLMIKGYHHFAGRAMMSLAVLESLAERLRDYEIVLYSVSSEPRQRAFELSANGILNIRVIDLATHDEILTLFGKARLYLGVSISDAISTSVLEAMAMGAFPIQTNTACADEWFEDGTGGFLVPPDNFDLIQARVVEALDNNELVDRAAAINYETAKARLDRRVLGPKIAAFYDAVLPASRTR